MREDVLRIRNGTRLIYGRIYYPDGDGRFPAIILSHGFNGSADDFVQECSYYAENGYIAYAYDFCGASDRTRSEGLNTTEMTIFTEKDDLLAVVDYIKGLDVTDPGHLYLFGGSQGGLVTLLTAEETGDDIRAAAVYFPALCIPEDWRSRYPAGTSVPEEIDCWGVTLGRDFALSIRDFDVFENLGKYNGAVYVIQGDEDPVVRIEDSMRAVDMYHSARLKILRGEGHGFTPEGRRIAMEEVLDFFQKCYG